MYRVKLKNPNHEIDVKETLVTQKVGKQKTERVRDCRSKAR